MATRPCAHCGRQLDETAKFCGQCGTVVDGDESSPPPTLIAVPIEPTYQVLEPDVPRVPPTKRTMVGLPPLSTLPGMSTGGSSASSRLASSDPFASLPGAASVAAPERRTVLGIAQPGIAPSQEAEPAAPVRERAARRTMLGVAQPGLAPSQEAEPVASGLDRAARRTMLGVAQPGVAPSQESQPAAGHGPARRTVVGVAQPGIAPLHAGELAPAHHDGQTTLAIQPRAISPGAATQERSMGETVAIPAFFVPPPPPLVEAAPPSRPQVARRPGAPLAVAALIAGGILVGGAAIALWWRSVPPIAAQPRVTPEGKDVLHLVCDVRSCADGTVVVSLDGTKTTFVGGEADLALASALHVGSNSLALSIDRPGMGRDETVTLNVPVAYRVRADITTMSAPRPSITIRVEAPAGTEVRVEDKPVTLDATGNGTYVVDESAMTEGPADESRAVSVEVPYVVFPKEHAPENGTVSARIAVAPLRVDAPSSAMVVDEDHVFIVGRAARGASVTVNGAAVALGPDGTFESNTPIDSIGEHKIEVRAGTAVLAPRTVHVSVTRVASLAQAAKTFEDRNPIGYAEAVRDIAAAKTGASMFVEGDVVEARGSGHNTVVLIDDRRGCDKGPCLVRVVIGQGMSFARGETVRAYGHVARAYRTPSAQTVPEVEAELVLRTKS